MKDGLAAAGLPATTASVVHLMTARRQSVANAREYPTALAPDTELLSRTVPDGFRATLAWRPTLRGR